MDILSRLRKLNFKIDDYIVADEIVSDIVDCLDVVVIHIYIHDFEIILYSFGCSDMATRPKGYLYCAS